MIIRIVGILLIAIVLIALALLLILAVSAALLGTGSILSRFFDVTLFQATILATAVTGSLAFVLVRILGMPIGGTQDWEDEDEDWEEEDDWEEDDWEEDDDLYEEEPEPISPRISRWRPRLTDRPSYENVGRNEPCPCGSGKKYKHCHGRTRR